MNTNSNLRDVPLEAMALEIKQGSIAGSLYVFAIDGKTIAKQLGVQRMTWHSGKLQGFQRQLDKNRVRVIAQYLGKNPVLPNALVSTPSKAHTIIGNSPSCRVDSSIAFSRCWPSMT